MGGGFNTPTTHTHNMTTQNKLQTIGAHLGRTIEMASGSALVISAAMDPNDANSIKVGLLFDNTESDLSDGEVEFFMYEFVAPYLNA